MILVDSLTSYQKIFRFLTTQPRILGLKFSLSKCKFRRNVITSEFVPKNLPLPPQLQSRTHSTVAELKRGKDDGMEQTQLTKLMRLKQAAGGLRWFDVCNIFSTKKSDGLGLLWETFFLREVCFWWEIVFMVNTSS